jgi:penicillin-binding protein-related factor A (putative recombinase)
MKKESIGERGKTAEKAVMSHFDRLNTRFMAFAYERTSDARAAGGRLKKQLSDFLCWWTGTSIPLEVKSTEHDYRLPSDHLTQLPRLKKVAKAGARPYVLVLFKGLAQWRIAPVDYFEFGKPSWDMRDLPLYASAQAALESTGDFPILVEKP